MGIHWFWHGPAGLYRSNWEGTYRSAKVYLMNCFNSWCSFGVTLKSQSIEQDKQQDRFLTICIMESKKNQYLCHFCLFNFISVSLPWRANSSHKLYLFCVGVWSSLFFTSLFSYCSTVYFVPHMLNASISLPMMSCFLHYMLMCKVLQALPSLKPCFPPTASPA